MPHLVVVADCGGTNSRLQIHSVEEEDVLVAHLAGRKAPGTLIHEADFSNESYSKVGKTFAHIYLDFLAAAFGASVAAAKVVHVAVIAVAGPVANNRVEFTNNAWSIDGDALAKKMGIGQVVLMNDFVASGYGLLTLDLSSASPDVTLLQAAQGGLGPLLGAPMACVGAGTGLGECFLTSPAGATDMEHYTAYPTEGGHTDFAPRSPLEFELLQFLMAKFGQQHRVSAERVVSGRGLANVFEFLAKHPSHKSDVNPTVLAAFAAAGDMQGRVVSDHAATDAVCQHALEIFVSAYGAEASNAALKYLPTGGLFLAGGLTPKNLQHLKGDAGGFLQAFRDKGRLSSVLRQVPVYAVLDEQLGQRGAHYVAVRLLKQQQAPKKELAAPLPAARQVNLLLALAVGAVAGVAAAKYIGRR